MDRGSAFRRAFHIASPIFLSYYILPDQITPNITRLSLAVLFIGTAGCIEIARIALGIKLFGMRPYEGQRVSAYAQGLLGLTVGIFLVQDPRIVVPVFLGMAWIDPLAAYARHQEWPLSVPIIAYFVLFVAAESAMGLVPSWTARLLFAALATATAIVVEGPLVPQVDDDLLMQLVPYAVLLAAFLVVPTAGLL